MKSRFIVIPVNGHEWLVITKHERLAESFIVIPASLVGIHNNSLDTGFRRYDVVDLHTNPEMLTSFGFLDPGARGGDRRR